MMRITITQISHVNAANQVKNSISSQYHIPELIVNNTRTENRENKKSSKVCIKIGGVKGHTNISSKTETSV